MNRRYPDAVVARCKALMNAGFTTKGLACLTGVPYETLVNWRVGKVLKDIPPDADIKRAIQELIG